MLAVLFLAMLLRIRKGTGAESRRDGNRISTDNYAVQDQIGKTIQAAGRLSKATSVRRCLCGIAVGRPDFFVRRSGNPQRRGGDGF